MAEDERLDAVTYLDRFFDELRDEVRTNPKFADRLVKAMGGKVVFDETTKTEIANPYILVAESSKSEFYSVFSPLKQSQLKKILKDNNLATSVDVRGKSASQLVDMLYDRASLKITERKSSYF